MCSMSAADIGSVLQMRDQIITLAALWQVDLVIVEDTSSGMGLIQLLKEQSRLNVVGRKPDADKETRMRRQQGASKRVASCSRAKPPGLPISRKSSLTFRVAATMTRSTRCCCFSSGSRKTSTVTSR